MDWSMYPGHPFNNLAPDLTKCQLCQSTTDLETVSHCSKCHQVMCETCERPSMGRWCICKDCYDQTPEAKIIKDNLCPKCHGEGTFVPEQLGYYNDLTCKKCQGTGKVAY